MSQLDPKTAIAANYDLIARAIAFIRQHYNEPPDVAAIAQYLGMEEAHFQQLFIQWAGMRPEQFLSYLTPEYAKATLARNQPASVATVLHPVPGTPAIPVKIFTRCSNGKKSDGTGEANQSNSQTPHPTHPAVPQPTDPAFHRSTLSYGIHATPFGSVLLATTDVLVDRAETAAVDPVPERAICRLQFLKDPNPARIEPWLRQEWPEAQWVEDSGETAALCDRIFAYPPVSPTTAPLPVLLQGTPFQLQVWQALLQIPFGYLTTYQTIAAAIGRPTAARAVGTAIGNNEIAYLVPCHRVIRESGELGGYRWGSDRKAAMLGWEASHLP